MHWFLIPILSALPTGDDARDFQVTVDPRVELLSVVFRLAGNDEYNQGRVPSYVSAVEEHFGEFRDNPVVVTARLLRWKRGVSYDAVMSLAVHLRDAESLEEAVPFEPRPAELDKRWRIAETALGGPPPGHTGSQKDFPATVGLPIAAHPAQGSAGSYEPGSGQQCP